MFFLKTANVRLPQKSIETKLAQNLFIHSPVITITTCTALRFRRIFEHICVCVCPTLDTILLTASMHFFSRLLAVDLWENV